jgi:hypothetical protein
LSGRDEAGRFRVRNLAALPAVWPRHSGDGPPLVIAVVRHFPNRPEVQEDERNPQRKALGKCGHMSQKEKHHFEENSHNSYSITVVFSMIGILRCFLYSRKSIAIKDAGKFHQFSAS